MLKPMRKTLPRSQTKAPASGRLLIDSIIKPIATIALPTYAQAPHNVDNPSKYEGGRMLPIGRVIAITRIKVSLEAAPWAQLFSQVRSF